MSVGGWRVRRVSVGDVEGVRRALRRGVDDGRGRMRREGARGVVSDAQGDGEGMYLFERVMIGERS